MKKIKAQLKDQVNAILVDNDKLRSCHLVSQSVIKQIVDWFGKPKSKKMKDVYGSLS